MATIDFYGPRLKVERAEQHIIALCKAFDDYLEKNSKTFSQGDNRRASKNRLTTVASLPRYLTSILGDAIHNLRAPLDLAYCVLVQANGGNVTRQTQFPFDNNAVAVTKRLEADQRKKSGPNDAVCDAIVQQIEPYPSGKLGLYELHRLDITDKHVALIPTSTSTHIGSAKVIDPTGRRPGSSILQDIVVTNLSDAPGSKTIAFYGYKPTFEGSAADIFKVCFQPGQPFGGQEILPVVNSLCSNVKTALSILEGAA